MKDTSRRALPTDVQEWTGRISLNRNGTFVASDMPAFFYVPRREAAQSGSGTGLWKLVSRDGQQRLQLDFQTIEAWKKEDLPYSTQLHVSSRSLFYFIGDPDEGRRVSFEKK